MRSRFLLAPVALLLAATPAAAAAVSQWRTTVEQVVNDIRINHPAPFTRVGELSFLREAAALISALPQLTDEQRMVQLMHLVATIGDGHTQLEPNDPAFALWYPMRIYEFSDGYYITAAHRSVREFAGAHVLEIGGHPIERVAEAARSLRGADNEFDQLQRLDVLENAALMRGLGFAGADHGLRIKARLSSGRVVERTLPAMPVNDPFYGTSDSSFDWTGRSEVYGAPVAPFEEWVTAFRGLPTSAFRQIDATRPPHFGFRRLEAGRAIPEHDAYYIQINGVAPDDLLPFLHQQLAAIDAQHPRRLIVDLRYNDGGDGSRVDEMIHQFVQREVDPPWREFYLITGRKTYSAAVGMVSSFIQNMKLTLVGEPPGSALNNYGDPAQHDYAAPAARLYVSTRRYVLSDSRDLSAHIAIDVPTPMSFADYAAGRDPAIDPILNGVEMRGIVQIARSDGGAAARRVYEERRARFAHLAWWAPPTELQLRSACAELRERLRLQDALDTCALSAEIHPYVWNAWYNLAEAQHVLGHESARAGSLRCVVLLDPGNFNRAEMEPILAAAGAIALPPGCPVEGGGR